MDLFLHTIKFKMFVLYVVPLGCTLSCYTGLHAESPIFRDTGSLEVGGVAFISSFIASYSPLYF